MLRTHDEQALRCRAQYMRWLLDYLLEHPDGFDISEVVMQYLMRHSEKTSGDVALDAYVAGWHDRGDPRRPQDFSNAEPALRGIYARLKAGA